jgi:hypothetical protein
VIVVAAELAEILVTFTLVMPFAHWASSGIGSDLLRVQIQWWKKAPKEQGLSSFGA